MGRHNVTRKLSENQHSFLILFPKIWLKSCENCFKFILIYFLRRRRKYDCVTKCDKAENRTFRRRWTTVKHRPNASSRLSPTLVYRYMLIQNWVNLTVSSECWNNHELLIGIKKLHVKRWQTRIINTINYKIKLLFKFQHTSHILNNMNFKFPQYLLAK